MAWNVHGLERKLFDPAFLQFCSSYDIFSCSEIYSCAKQKIESAFPQFDCEVSYREKFIGGGVTVCIRKSLKERVKVIPNEMKECICLLLDESILNTEHKVIACFPYIAHECSPVYNNETHKGINSLDATFHALNERFGPVEWLIAGDMNARTGTLDDFYASNNVHSYLCGFDIPDELNDEINSGRNSLDTSFVNNYGKTLVSFCKENSLYILNGRAHGDERGNITCIANKGKTIVDYFITSKAIFDRISEFKVSVRPESDHFPLHTMFKSHHNC